MSRWFTYWGWSNFCILSTKVCPDIFPLNFDNFILASFPEYINIQRLAPQKDTQKLTHTHKQIPTEIVIFLVVVPIKTFCSNSFQHLYARISKGSTTWMLLFCCWKHVTPLLLNPPAFVDHFSTASRTMTSLFFLVKPPSSWWSHHFSWLIKSETMLNHNFPGKAYHFSCWSTSSPFGPCVVSTVHSGLNGPSTHEPSFR